MTKEENDGNGIGDGKWDDKFVEVVADFKRPWTKGMMKIERAFTSEGRSPFEYDVSGNKIKWISEEVKITDDSGKVVFVQPSVSRPGFWSPLAIKVVA